MFLFLTISLMFAETTRSSSKGLIQRYISSPVMERVKKTKFLFVVLDGPIRRLYLPFTNYHVIRFSACVYFALYHSFKLACRVLLILRKHTDSQLDRLQSREHKQHILVGQEELENLQEGRALSVI